MTATERKSLRQEQIVTKWLKILRGTLQAVTGFGKTRVAVLIIQKMLTRDPQRTTLVIVPSAKLYDDWTNPTTGHLAVYGLTGVTVAVINTAIRHTYQTDLLVLDEIHNYAAETFKQVFAKVQYKWLLGLTADISRLDGKHDLLEQFAPVFDTVDMREAQREGYVSKFIIYNLAVKLSLADQLTYEKLTNQMNNTFARFGHDFELAKRCSAGKAMGGDRACQAYARQMGWDQGKGKADPWSPESIAKYAAQWGRGIRERKKLLYNAEGKLDAAEQVLRKFNQIKAITFAESTDFADELARRLAPEALAYHSGLKPQVEHYEKVTTYKTKPNKVEQKTRKLSPATIRRKVLEQLADPGSPVRILATARALDEGFDVADIELSLVCSSTSAPRQDTQRSGRAIRYVEGKTALVVNLYIPDTQDEKWLRKRQVKATRIEWISSVDQISYERPAPTGFSLTG